MFSGVLLIDQLGFVGNSVVYICGGFLICSEFVIGIKIMLVFSSALILLLGLRSTVDDQILDYRKRLEQTDVMLIMSPCHNYIMNSATENFIANIFTPPWSFSYKKIFLNYGFPKPGVLKGKIAIIGMTYGGPSFFVSAIMQQIPRRVKAAVFKGLCGMSIKYLRMYEVLPNMPKEIFEKHMKKVRKTVQEL